MAHRRCTDLPAPMFLQVGIFHCSLFNGDNRARVSLVPVSSTQRLCWYTAHLAMSTSSTQDEPSSPPGVEGAVPVSARVCDFDPRKTCLAELGGVGKESKCRSSSGQEN